MVGGTALLACFSEFNFTRKLLLMFFCSSKTKLATTTNIAKSIASPGNKFEATLLIMTVPNGDQINYDLCCFHSIGPNWVILRHPREEYHGQWAGMATPPVSSPKCHTPKS